MVVEDERQHALALGIATPMRCSNVSVRMVFFLLRILPARFSWRCDAALCARSLFTRLVCSKQNKLSLEREETLNKLGFEWDVDSISWERAFGLYKTFKADNHNHDPPSSCTIPGGDKGDDVLFWVWARTQRRGKNKGTLSPEKSAKLDKIGFNWQD